MDRDLSYHLTGLVQAALFSLTIVGLWIQLRTIWKRKAKKKELTLTERATQTLSLNLLLASLCAYQSYYLFAASSQPMIIYIIATRIPALSLTLLIVREIAIDRSTTRTRLAFFSGAIIFILSVIATIFTPTQLIAYHRVFHWLVLGSGGLLLQGQLHQLMLIRKAQSAGALSFQARFLNLCKDISLVVFAFAIGADQAWPLIVVNSANAFLTALVLFEMKSINGNGSLRDP